MLMIGSNKWQPSLLQELGQMAAKETGSTGEEYGHREGDMLYLWIRG